MNIPLEEIIESFEDCRRNKRSTYNELEFEINRTENLVNLWRDLKNDRYQIGKSIAFVVKYPKPREIFAADFRDRIIHHFIIRHLESYFEKDFIDDNYNCRVGKGTLYGVKRLSEKIKVASENYTRNDLWVGKFDMKGFFMSIDKEILWRMLEKFIQDRYDGPYKNEILILTEKVVKNRPQDNCIRRSDLKDWELLGEGKSLFTINPELGLPIGNLTSQVFANFYLHEFDREMLELYPLGYGRYVDDFYVLARSKEDITKKVNWMREYLHKNLKVNLHKDKVYIQHYKKGIKFTGGVVMCNRIYTGNRPISKLLKIIHWYNTQEFSTNLLWDLSVILNSYLGLLKHSQSYGIRKKVWESIAPDWKEKLTFNSSIYKASIRKDYRETYVKLNEYEQSNGIFWTAARFE